MAVLTHCGPITPYGHIMNSLTHLMATKQRQANALTSWYIFKLLKYQASWNIITVTSSKTKLLEMKATIWYYWNMLFQIANVIFKSQWVSADYVHTRACQYSRDAGGLRRHCAHDDVTVLIPEKIICQYGLSVTLLAKAVYGRNLLTVYVRVQ